MLFFNFILKQCNTPCFIQTSKMKLFTRNIINCELRNKYMVPEITCTPSENDRFEIKLVILKFYYVLPPYSIDLSGTLN